MSVCDGSWSELATFSSMTQSIISSIEGLLEYIYSQLPLYRSRRDRYFSFNMTEFCYKGSNISAMKALGERTHLDINGHFFMIEFDTEAVHCI